MERGIFRSSQRFQREPHNVRESEAVFSIATTSAARYVSDSSSENTTRLDESLNDLIKYISDVDRAARLTLKNWQLKEFLAYTPVILNANTTSIVTRSKFYRLLFNIAHHNIPLRRYMAVELRLLGAVFSCLKASLREQLGPQNMIDILRLMQVLSYEKDIPLEHWANEFISFLIGEVIREPEPEWMPYCIAILCNLASGSKSVCRRIKISSSYKKFNRQLMKLLQHEARIIVVSSLVLIGYLDEKVRDMVYCTENVHDTFMCTFNVLNIGDDECLMTRHIAADLLKRLVVSESVSGTGVPTLASTGKNVLNYGFFLGSIQQTARLLVTLDPRTEESSKIVELLLAFCSLQALRSAVCQAVVRCLPTEHQLTTPLMAIAETAALNDPVFRDAPLKALKLLTYLLKEVVEGEPQERLAPEISTPQIVGLVESAIRVKLEVVDGAEEELESGCRRVQLGLRLAEVCARDEQCRTMLLSVCTAQLCWQIANWQFLQNPVVTCLVGREHRPWTLVGIGIVLELCRLLAVLKDHSKVHKDQYWQLLKDERVIPFLAYAISFGDQETVQHAFLTYSHCVQLPSFRNHLLAELVASCKSSSHHWNSEEDKPKSSQDSSQDRPSSNEPDERSQKALDELLRKVSLEGGSVLKDVKTSELLAAYERKIHVLQSRERELETLLRAKDEALVQSEKLRHYRVNCPSDTEISKLREMSQECETLRDQNKQLTDYVQSLKTEYEANVVKTGKDVDRLRFEMEEAQNAAEAFSANCRNLEERLVLEAAERSALKKEVETVKENAELLDKANQREILKLNTDLAQKVARIEHFLAENTDLRRQFEEKNAENEVLKEHIVQAELKIEQTSAKLCTADQIIVLKDAKIAASEQHLKTYEQRLSETEHKLKDAEILAGNLKSELENARLHSQKLEKLREAMISLASNN